jgi:predicted DNA binding CopG/RHH family protein
MQYRPGHSACGLPCGMGTTCPSPPAGGCPPVYVQRILAIVAERRDPLDGCTGFEWDEANAQKNWERHHASGTCHDSTEFIDWHAAQQRRFPDLKPSLRTISLRLPVSMIEDLKVLANKRNVPYQSLLKVFLAERLERERRRA